MDGNRKGGRLDNLRIVRNNVSMDQAWTQSAGSVLEAWAGGSSVDTGLP